MRRYLFPALVLSIGLITAQVLFSIIVYLSNISLYQHLLVIKAADYLIVPSDQVMQGLREPGPAFCGGLFFTLTTGAGLSLSAFVLTLCLRLFFAQRRFILLLILFLWAIIIFKLNANGLNLYITAAFIIIPVVVAIATLNIYPAGKGSFRWHNLLSHTIAFLILLLIWSPHLNSKTFISIRDLLLMPSSIGQKLNGFYYKYTLYPAQVFKSFDQKLLKTCDVQIKDIGLYDRVEKQLRGRDYLNINAKVPVDLTLRHDGHNLIFLNQGRTIQTTTVKDFFDDPGGSLKSFSQKCDKNIFFRKITLLSLMVGFPIACYVLLHAIIMLALLFIPSPAIRSLSATISCLLIGIALTLPLYYGLPQSIPSAEVFNSLKSQNWRERVAALRTILDEHIVIDRFHGLETLAESRHVPERYWLARSLGNGHIPETYKMILRLLDDSHPNVVCMALFSLGKRNQEQAHDIMLNQIKTSSHWYIQRYAYKALKRLKWTQSKSIHIPSSWQQQ